MFSRVISISDILYSAKSLSLKNALDRGSPSCIMSGDFSQHTNIPGDELFSDTYPMKLVDDCIYEVYGKVSRPFLESHMVRRIMDYVDTEYKRI